MESAGFMLLVFTVSLWPGDARFIIEPLSLIKQESLDTCTECSQIIRLSENMISGSDTKEAVYETLHALCQHLPGDQASECDSQVKTYLPKILQQTPGHLKTGEICVVFGLCAAHKEEELQKPTYHVTNKDESSAALGTGTETLVSGVYNPVCTLCMMFIKKLETMLPQNMTEDTIIKVMDEVCHVLPQSYRDQCDDFVEKYGAQIVEFLLSSAAPYTICSLLHLCLFEEKPVEEVLLPSDCDSCRTLATLSRLHHGLNATEPQTSAFLQSVCVSHPNAIPKCEAFIRIYGSQLLKVLGNQMEAPHACERASLCAASKKMELLGNNPCTWGPSYWCKDTETAQKCGNRAFCEKYMWMKNE